MCFESLKKVKPQCIFKGYNEIVLSSLLACMAIKTQMHSLTLLISEQEDVEGVCGSALTDLSSTPEFNDRLSQGKRLEMMSP